MSKKPKFSAAADTRTSEYRFRWQSSTSTKDKSRSSKLSRAKRDEPVLTEEENKYINDLLKQLPKNEVKSRSRNKPSALSKKTSTADSDTVKRARSNVPTSISTGLPLSNETGSDKRATDTSNNKTFDKDLNSNSSASLVNGANNTGNLTQSSGCDLSAEPMAMADNSAAKSCDEDDSFLDGLDLCSQEPLLNSSQDGEYCEVRWSCTSPETIKQLKKLRGQYNAEGVKKIMANFSDAHVKPQKTFLKNTEIFMPPKESQLSSKTRLQRAKERAAKRHRNHNKQAVQAMIKILKGLSDKEKTENKEREQLKSPSNASSSSKSVEGCDKTEEASCSSNPPSACDNDDDDMWSDDDLFRDNSFLIEATQNPEKFLNTSRDLAYKCKQNNEKLSSTQTGASPKPTVSPLVNTSSQIAGPKASESLLDDSAVVPSSYISRQSSIAVRKPSVIAPVKTMYTSSSTSSSSSFGTGGKTASCKSSAFQRQAPYYSTTSNRTSTAGSTTNSAGNNKSCSSNSYAFKPLDTSTSQRSNVFSKPASSLAAKTSNPFNAKCTSSVNKFVSQNSKTASINPAPATYSRSTFRKVNSFQVGGSSTQQQQNSVLRNQSPNTSLNTSFKRSLSFDNKCSPGVRTSNYGNKASVGSSNRLIKPAITSTATKFSSVVSCSARPDVKVSTSTNVQRTFAFKQTSKPQNSTNNASKGNDISETHKGSDNNVSSGQEDGYDLSLPEDVLKQLLEPDEILDSQAGLISADSKTNSAPAVHTSSSRESLVSKTETSNATCKVSSAGPSSSYISQTSTASFSKVAGHNTNALKPINRQSNSLKLTETILSPVKPVSDAPMQTFFKKTFSVHQLSSPYRMKTPKHSLSSGPSSSTPVKHAKIGESDSDTGNKAAENNHGFSDSFMESAFDDSFMNDVAMYESQIVPMLEKVEAEALGATQNKEAPCVSNKCSPGKCSPEEIEQKRLAALQRRSSRLSQMNNASCRK